MNWHIQGRHGEFEPSKAQYSTPKLFDQLFLINAYWNPKFRQGPGFGGLASRGGPANTWELSLIRLFIYIYFKITLEHKSLAAAFLRIIIGVPDEWSTTKCGIVRKFCSNYWNEINIIIVLHFYIFMWFFLPPYLSRRNVHLRTLTIIFFIWFKYICSLCNKIM